MENRISVGELRQNPTAMLRSVRGGAVWTITDHGEPVAEVSPLRPQPWVAAADVSAVLAELGEDSHWADELSTERQHAQLQDPWGTES